MNKLLKVNCPQCEKVFYYYESEFRPFCTERCKMIDLGHWFEESYRVPTTEINKIEENNESKNENKEKGSNQNEYQDENEQGFDEASVDIENDYDENDY
jgi:endogenous inhibitor of DNA gyrase (YacG/DUF329 family)